MRVGFDRIALAYVEEYGAPVSVFNVFVGGRYTVYWVPLEWFHCFLYVVGFPIFEDFSGASYCFFSGEGCVISREVFSVRSSHAGD